MRALITGGAGFIGSHLAEFLLTRGDEVVVIDDLSTGAMANISHLKPNPRFACHIDSVMNRPLMADLMDNCDVVFHLAAAVGVRLIVENPVRSITNNILGAELVLQLAARTRRKVLMTSSSEVYGSRTDAPLSECSDLLIGPPNRRRWSYACSKAADEFLAMAYWDEHEVPVVIARLFNTVGPRQTGRYGMVVPRFVEQALSGEPITVYGDGQQSRCFAYVGDVARILVRLADLPQAVGEIINVGNDEEITMLSLARQVKAQTESTSEIVFVSYDVAYTAGFEDMQRRVPDLEKLERLLSDRPRTSLREILDSAIAYARVKREGSLSAHQAVRRRAIPRR